MKSNYRRMLGGMQAKAGSGPARERETWFLYILECNDGSFYTGITKDLQRRISQHNAGKASRYTRLRRPVRLRYQEACAGRIQALMREFAVKSLSRKAKEDLIGSQRTP